MKRIVFCSLLIVALFFVYSFFTSDGTCILSKNYKYAYDQKAIFGKGTLPDVPPYIVFYCDDKQFILVKQNPHYYYDELYKYNSNYSYKNGIKEYYYWVIVKKTDEIFGPMIEEEFTQTVIVLDVSEKLLRKFKRLDSNSVMLLE